METLMLPDHVWATHGTPLIEVFSVYIENHYGEIDCRAIYGDITITDGEGVTFHLYKRLKKDPEIVTTGQPLSLTFPEYHAISPNGIVKVKVRLKAVDQTMLVDNICEWDYRYKNDYDKPQTERIEGNYGLYAAVNYIAYRCAVIGYPLACLSKEEGDGDSAADARQVYGRIVASRVNKHQCIGSGATTIDIMLFDESKDEPVWMEYENTYEMFGALVVPAYSYLKIDARLKDGNTSHDIACGRIELDSKAYGRTDGLCGPLKLEIDWCHPYSLPPPRRNPKRSRKTSSGGEKVYSQSEEENKKTCPWVPVSSPQAASMAMSSNWPSPNYVSVMEIFSVCVGDKISKLSGSILVSDNYKRGLIIYKREKHTPEELSQDNEVASIDIVGPPDIIEGNIFYVHLYLKDDQDRQVADGLFQWRNDAREHWLGKRMCSLVTGKHGYAAVHYTVFRAGLPATVEVSLLTSKPGQYIIYGTIVSEYGNYKCLTQHEKEFYRSRLFVKPETNPFKSCSQSSFEKIEIPLLKGVVAVPKESSLDLHFDLHVENPNGFVERVNNTASSEFSPSPVSVMYEGTMFSLGLDVKWG